MRADTMRQACGPVLAALEKLLGATAASDPGRFWPALAGRANGGFGAGGTSRMPAEFCRQAENNMNTCRARQESMGTFGAAAHNSSGQAGAFGDCYKIYSAAFGMCRMTDRRVASRGPGGRQAGGTPMSPQCQAIVQRYIAAAQAHDGPQAVADYNALKQLGGCGVLDKIDQQPLAAGPSADDPRFKARGATPLSDQIIGGCDAAPDVCAAYVQQLRAGVSPEAQAAIFNNAISVGLALGGMMANGLSMAGPHGGTYSIGGGPNMNSIGNRPVRSTYGQGSPTGPAPPPPRYGGQCPGGGPCATTAR
jgi:hypothetical protein